jgi:signal transduction histidine kinase
MSFFRSLQFRLSALVLLFGALLIGFGVTHQSRRDIERQLEQRRDGAIASCTRLAGVAQHVFRRNLPSTLDLELGYLAARREMKLGGVTDSGNRLLNVTARDWQGRPMEESPLRVAVEAAGRARETMSSLLKETETEIVAVAPFLMGREMRGRGVVVLAYDKRDILARAWREATEEAIRFAAFLLGASLMLWLALNVLVTERVRRVVKQTEEAAQGEEGLPPLEGKDEIALMSQAFDSSLRARQALWQSQQPLWKLVEGLKDLFWSVSLAGDGGWYVNPAYEAVWGGRVSELKENRMAWLRRISKADRRRALGAMRRLERGEPVDDLRLKVTGEEGGRWLLCRGFTVRGYDGRIISMAGLVMDVTEAHMVNRRLAEVAEQERRRIGWDLHDDLCQRLVGVLFKCNSMAAAMKRDELPTPDRMARIVEEITETTQLARGLARGLAPVLEGGGGLEAALEHLALHLNRTFQVRCETALDPRLPALKPEAATHLYRIAQELATNAVKHGGATQLEILFWKEDRDLQLQIRSNGRPFEGLGAGMEENGMGMHMVKQRLEMLGAQLHFKASSAADPWNLAVCEVPISEVEERAEAAG